LLAWLESKTRFSEASGNGAGLMLPSDECCPQCHAPYKVEEDHIVPIVLIRIVGRLTVWKDGFLLYSALGGAAVSILTVAGAYGGLVLWSVAGGQSLLGLLSSLPMAEHVLLVNPSFSSVGERAVTAMRTIIGLPLISVYVLSLKWSTPLSWLYPLIPPLVMTSRSPLMQWPPTDGMLCCALPFIVTLYNGIVRQNLISSFKKYVLPQASFSSSSNSSISVRRTSRSPSVTSDDGEDEDEEDRVLRVSVIETMAVLLLPFASAGLGWLLFRRHFPSLKLYRTILGGSLLVLASDMMSTFCWWQQSLARLTRRVLDYNSRDAPR